MRRLPGLITWWSLIDTAGATADNTEGTAARDGTYVGNVTLAAAAFPAGGLSPSFPGGTAPRSYVNIYSASLDSVFNGNLGWATIWFKHTGATLTDGAQHYLMYAASSVAGNQLSLTKETTNYSHIYSLQGGGGTIRRLVIQLASQNWQNVTMTWNQAGNEDLILVNGVLHPALAGTGVWTGNLVANKVNIGQSQDIGSALWAGNLAHAVLGAGQVLTEVQLNALWEAVYPGSREITFTGDSKSNTNDDWCGLTIAGLEISTGDVWRERPARLAVSGYKASDLHTYLDANLPGTIGNPQYVLVTIGSNDLNAGTAEAAFKTALTGCIDAYLTKFPSTAIYVAYPWRQGFDAESLTMKGWIDAVIAAYGSGVAAGHDENVWFKPNVGIYSTDGIHYNTAAGQAAAVAQWKTVLGY